MTAFMALVALVLVALFFQRSAGLRGKTHAHALDAGMEAPAFELSDAQGRLRRETEFRGEWLLLYFYPKDDTRNCTKQACAFRERYEELRARGVQVVGVSVDGVASHRAFSGKNRLSYPLLSDRRGAVAARYDALWSWGPIRFAKRRSFLIDPTGRIVKIYRNIDVDSHPGEVLDDLNDLGGTTKVAR